VWQTNQAAIAKLNGLNTDLKRIEEMNQTWIFQGESCPDLPDFSGP